MLIRIFSLALLIGLSTTTTNAAEEWPQFRGPSGDGHAGTAGLPLQWSETQHVAWKKSVPGEGFSSPVISGTQLWLTTALVDELTPEEQEAKLATLENSRGVSFGGPLTLKAICYDIKTGEVLHEVTCFEFDFANPKHATNSYASPTPILEANRLYCHFGDYGTCCIDTEEGEKVWENQELHVDHQNGPGSSPVLWQDLLIVHFDGTDQQFIAAFNKNTGKIAWQTSRSGEMNPKGEMQKAYCTPVIQEVSGQPQLISPAADWVYAYNPQNGSELWKASYGKLGFSTVPKPVTGNGMVYVCTSFMKSRLLAVKYDGQGDVTESHIAWTSDRQIPQKPSLLLLEDKLFFTGDGGVSTCLNAITGEQIWQERMPGQYAASPLFANGMIYLFNQEGVTTVLDPSENFAVVAENKLPSGCMATPAVAGDALFIRTMTDLYRIEN